MSIEAKNIMHLLQHMTMCIKRGDYMFTFNLQLFGGGGKGKSKSSTSVKLLPSTQEEQSALVNQLDYINAANPAAHNALQMGNRAMSGAQLDVDYQGLYNRYFGQNNNNLNNVNNMNGQTQSAMTNNANANAQYGSSMGKNMQAMNNTANTLNEQYKNALADFNSNYGSIANGQLPSEYSKNRETALNSQLQNTVGNALTNLASRGVINSSQADTAFNGISKNASDTLASQYASDLGQAASLASNGFANNLSGLGAQQGLWANQYANNMSGLAQQAGLANQSYANMLNGISTGSNLANQSETIASNPLQYGGQAQLNAIAYPAQMYQLSAALNNPNSNLWESMMRARYGASSGNTTTTQQQPKGNFFTGLVGGFCFTAGTEIATPTGAVNIEAIQDGDQVLTLGGVINVIKLHKMSVKPIYNLKTTRTNVNTTATEKFMTRDGFKVLTELAIGDEIMTVHDYDRVTEITATGSDEQVFVLECDGSNTFYANGVLAEGLTEADKIANGTPEEVTEESTKEVTEFVEEKPKRKSRTKKTEEVNQ